MLHIALVEDDDLYAEKLKSYLDKYAAETGEKIDVVTYSDGEDITADYRPVWDILLMDIEMRFMDGMTAAGMIRSADPEVIIIFITNSPQYAIRGYSVNALDYVLKPISYFAFSERINRACQALDARRHRERFVMLTDSEATHRVNVTEIRSVETDGRLLVYHTGARDIRTWGAMNHAEEELGSHFYRCNKGILVNLAYVDAIEGSDVVVDGRRLPISRAKKVGLLDALNQYMNEVGR